MIFFLYGKDAYRRLLRKKAILSELSTKYPDILIGRFSAEDGNKVREFLRGISLFSPKKLCALEDFGEIEDKEAKDLLSPYVSSKEVAIMVSADDKPRKALSFLLEKPVHCEEFPSLEGARLINFIKKEAEAEGMDISSGAATILAEAYAGDTFALATEIKKLALFGKKTISERELSHIGREGVIEYWPLLNSLKSQAPKARLWALFRLSAQREQAAKTFNILAAGAKPKAAMFAEYDLLIKSGKLEYEEALLDFALR